ncbi:MAG TPA: polynucleotide adenylyltransferase PcnB [Caldimonas sp.]|jgi:poly(A) polymerase|nr:polynucleotide adenylyltransferase PcnB [Caldimonas sp.]HEV7577770.1 polynucleotide adenylyltransferase PcnB [Caldimonas sp.]
MIKKFISKLLGKSNDAAGAVPRGKRVEVPKSEHGIDPALVDERAVKVVSTLAEAGYEAYVVGGAVRDLLVGLRPKDFDVATDATPEQVKALFRRAFIIGRRFRIVHVVFGRGRQDRGLSEVIEVSTFRAMLAAADAEQVSGNEKTSRKDLVDKTHVVDAEGRVLRDNVWGPQVEDAARRDFTVNAMYYDPVREIVVDYHGGIRDAKKKLLRMIGDPASRYREDPVRIIRAVRFAAKLGFEIEAKTRAPIKEMAALLDNVPQSRTFDEMIKLLQTGHALASIVELKKLGLHRGVFPVLDVALDEAQRHDGREQFVRLALADTDARVAEGKPVAPSFMLAAMLWHDVQDEWKRRQAAGETPFPALQGAIDAAFDARIGDISGRGKLAVDMREIWMLQPRFERRASNSALALLEQPRFRAGLDFLRLRGEVGEADPELAVWWEALFQANDEKRRDLLDGVREQRGPRRVKRTAPRGEGGEGDAGGDRGAGGAGRERGAGDDRGDAVPRLSPAHEAGDAAEGGDGADDEAGAADGAAAPRKRRRRRRRPADPGGPPTT